MLEKPTDKKVELDKRPQGAQNIVRRTVAPKGRGRSPSNLSGRAKYKTGPVPVILFGTMKPIVITQTRLQFVPKMVQYFMCVPIQR